MTIVTTSDPKSHIVVTPLSAWGHARPLTALVARFVQLRPVVVTLFVPKVYYQKVDVELTRGFEPEDIHLKDRVRLVALTSGEEGPLDFAVYHKSYTDAYAKLVNEEPISCVQTGRSFDGIRAPDAVIMDLFLFQTLSTIKAHSRKQIKVYAFCAWMGTAVWSFVHQWADLLDSGPGRLREQVVNDAAASGRSLADYTRDLYHGVYGRTVVLPGFPTTYDHEEYPQEPSIDIAKDGVMHIDLLEAYRNCDGIISPAPNCIEAPETLEVLTRWLKGSSRDIYGLGPILPTTKHSAEKEKTLSIDAARIDAYMERSLRANGAQSMIFMSFGSLFWPADTSKLWAFVDVLIERKIPFVLSCGSKDATVSTAVLDKIHSADAGIITTWAPQQAILAHPVTGWFITHAGFNSMMESIVAGVPMICWPFLAEQPLNAIHLTDNLQIAYELFEIRTGEHATKPIYRTGKTPAGTLEAVRAEAADILDKAFGADGKVKRANVLKIREAALAAVDPDGTSSRDMDRFLDALCA